MPPGQTASPWDDDAFARAAQGKESYSTVLIEDKPARVFSAPLRRAGQVAGVVQVEYSLADGDLALSDLDRTLLTLIPVALAAVGLAGLFLTGRRMRPVRQVQQTAERIGAKDLSERMEVRGQDE